MAPAGPAIRSGGRSPRRRMSHAPPHRIVSSTAPPDVSMRTRRWSAVVTSLMGTATTTRSPLVAGALVTYTRQVPEALTDPVVKNRGRAAVPAFRTDGRRGFVVALGGWT